MSGETNHKRNEAPPQIDHFLAEWLSYREHSVRGFATALGVSHSKVSRIQTGESELRLGFARKVARFLRIPTFFLYEVNPLTKEGRQTAEMYDAWQELDAGKRDDVLLMMRALGGKRDKRDAS